MFKSFLNHINTEKSFENKDTIILAISGGVDSMVLLHLMQRSPYDFKVAHFDHKTRKGASTQDAEFLRSYCKERQIEFHIKEMSEPWKLSNFQAEARRQRYEFFNSLKPDCLVTAHHLDDMEETILMNLLQGKSLNTIPVTHSNIVRPLSIFSKKEISQYAQKESVPFRMDESNLDNAYLRNYVRNQILEPLNKVIPDHSKRVLNISNEINDRLRILNELIEDRLLPKEQGNRILLDKKSILSLGVNVEKILGIHLSKYGFNSTQTENIFKGINNSGLLFEAENWTLLVDRDQLIIRKKDLSQDKGLAITIDISSLPLELEFRAGKFNIDTVNEADELGDPNVLYCPLNKLTQLLILRTWKEGDRFQPYGMQGRSQSLKKYFANNKIDRFNKEEIFVLTDQNDRIIWLVSLRNDHRFRIEDNSSELLRIRFEDKHPD